MFISFMTFSWFSESSTLKNAELLVKFGNLSENKIELIKAKSKSTCFIYFPVQQLKFYTKKPSGWVTWHKTPYWVERTRYRCFYLDSYYKWPTPLFFLFFLSFFFFCRKYKYCGNNTILQKKSIFDNFLNTLFGVRTIVNQKNSKM